MNSFMPCQSVGRSVGDGPRWPHSHVWVFSGVSWPFFLHVVSLKEGSLGLVTRVQYFKRVIMKGASWGLGLEVLLCYFFQDILVKVSDKDSLDLRGRKIESTFSQVIHIVHGHV